MRIAALVLVLVASGAAADEVTLQTPTGVLYGTLLMPKSPPPVPAVLIIAGSGPTDRDGNFASYPGPNNSLRMLAEALAARGIASLRYDKRGVAASAAAMKSESDMTVDIEIGDAVGWLQQLRSDLRFSLLIVAGHSEGSLIGIVAAQRVAVDRVISLAGAGRRVDEVILSELEGQISPELMAAVRQILASLNAGVPVANVPLALWELFRPSVQPYLISWLRYDPAQEIARLTVPTLVVQGTTDTEASIEDAMLLWNANRAAGLEIIPGMNHVLKDVPLDDVAQDRSYSDPTLPIDAALVARIGDFINPPIRHRAVR